MGRINLLDTETSNKIAAGEVVQKPVSAVKELVENSIDASSNNITIEIKDGGIKEIKIIDDGQGIHPDDIEKAFYPHATSKIKNINDIFKISTLGFRGEALASIASVSNVVLKSRTSEFDCGKEISISGGKINYIKDTACNIGTTVTVSDLFFNTPARLKFLKNAASEGSKIGDLIERIAIANHDKSFTFINNGKKNLSTYSTSDLKDTLRNIYGKNYYENVIEFSKSIDIGSAYGFVGNESLCRGTRTKQSIFVNKRYIKSRLITAAVENAYKSFITVNKFPFYVLFIDLFPEYVDVNIHPSKSEIKFKDEKMIFSLVFNSVHNALSENAGKKFNPGFEDTLKSDIKKVENMHINIPFDLKTDVSPINHSSDKCFNNEVYENSSVKESNELNYVVPCNADEQKKPQINPKFVYKNIIGQYNKTYILIEGYDGLYIVDQHAAHEKILFEKFRNDVETSKTAVQLLLTPVMIELGFDDYSVYKENYEFLKKSGFDVEDFGDNTVRINEVPIILGKCNPEETFLSIIDNLKHLGSGKTSEIKYHAIATQACKAAVKAHDFLTPDEIRTLIDELSYIEAPFNCPHGRPTIIKLTLEEIEKRFKRT